MTQKTGPASFAGPVFRLRPLSEGDVVEIAVDQERQLERKQQLCRRKVDPADGFDLCDAVVDGVAVQKEPLGGVRLVKAALGEYAQRLVELGAFFAVVVDERVERGMPDEGQQAFVLDLIEQRIYERQALLCRYRYLLARARELGLHTVLTKYQPQI